MVPCDAILIAGLLGLLSLDHVAQHGECGNPIEPPSKPGRFTSVASDLRRQSLDARSGRIAYLRMSARSTQICAPLCWCVDQLRANVSAALLSNS